MTNIISQVSVKWIDATLMAGMDSRGRSMVIGEYPGNGSEWLGHKGSDLLLLAAASCSTYDVVTILKKQRVPLEKLDVICQGEQENDPPNRFTSIHLHYIIQGAVDPEKVKKAIQLSEEKYCSVIVTLKPAVSITSDFEIRQA